MTIADPQRSNSSPRYRSAKRTVFECDIDAIDGGIPSESILRDMRYDAAGGGGQVVRRVEDASAGEG